MPFKVDPEVERLLTSKTGGKHPTKPPIEDIESRREGTTKAGLALFSTFPTHPEVSIQDFYTPSKSDSHFILLRWYSPKKQTTSIFWFRGCTVHPRWRHDNRPYSHV
jgi:hypothetical protein